MASPVALDEEENESYNKRKHDVRNRVQVSRPIYSENDFQQKYKYMEDHVGTREQIQRKLKEIDCSPKGGCNVIVGLLPILQWLPGYHLREDILGDVISGLTTAVMRIPQGKAKVEVFIFVMSVP